MVIDRVASAVSSLARMPVALGSSRRVSPSCVPRETEPKLVLFDQATEGQSRAVREALTYLDLCVTVYPCAQGSRHVYATTPWKSAYRRPKVPVLLDGSVRISGANQIVDYLLSEYEECDPPRRKKRSFGLDRPTHAIASASRFYRGNKVSRDAPLIPPKQPLELYSFEGCLNARIITERLHELDIPFKITACGKGSRRIDQLRTQISKQALYPSGSLVPYLYDPNSGYKSPPGDEYSILQYINKEYARAHYVLPQEPRPHSALRRRSLKAIIATLGARTRKGLDTFDDSDRKLFDYAITKLIDINPTATRRRSSRGGPISSGLLDASWKLEWTTKPQLLKVMREGMMGLPCQAITQTFNLPKSRLEINTIFAPDSSTDIDRFIDNPDSAPAFLRRTSIIKRPTDIQPSSTTASFDADNEQQLQSIEDDQAEPQREWTRTATSSVPSLVALIPSEESNTMKHDDNDDTLIYVCSSCLTKFQTLKCPLPPVGSGSLAIVYLDDDFCIQLDSDGDYLILTRRLVAD